MMGIGCEGPTITIKGTRNVQIQHLDAGIWSAWKDVQEGVAIPVDVGGVRVQGAEPGMMVIEWQGDFDLASGTKKDAILKLKHTKPIEITPVLVERPSSGADGNMAGPGGFGHDVTKALLEKVLAKLDALLAK